MKRYLTGALAAKAALTGALTANAVLTISTAAKTVLTLGLFLVLSLGAVSGAGAAAKASAPFEPLGYDDLKTLVAENKGKVVMINFFAVWCPPCREEIPGLTRIRKDYSLDKLVVIGASLDEDETALREFMAAMKINYPVKKAGLDLAQAASVRGIPHMLIFGPDGNVAGNQSGFIPEKILREFIDKLLEAK